MQKNAGEFSTNCVSAKLLDEIKRTLEGLDYGSVEIYVAEGEVTQITQRRIRKTKNLAGQALTRVG